MLPGSINTSNFVKREPSVDVSLPASKILGDRLRSASPPIWSCNIRERRLQQDGFVEVPEAIIEHDKLKRKLELQEEYIRAQQRLEKGKAPVSTQVKREVTRLPKQSKIISQQGKLDTLLKPEGEYFQDCSKNPNVTTMIKSETAPPPNLSPNRKGSPQPVRPDPKAVEISIPSSSTDRQSLPPGETAKNDGFHNVESLRTLKNRRKRLRQSRRRQSEALALKERSSLQVPTQHRPAYKPNFAAADRLLSTSNHPPIPGNSAEEVTAKSNMPLHSSEFEIFNAENTELASLPSPSVSARALSKTLTPITSRADGISGSQQTRENQYHVAGAKSAPYRRPRPPPSKTLTRRYQSMPACPTGRIRASSNASPHLSPRRRLWSDQDYQPEPGGMSAIHDKLTDLEQTVRRMEGMLLPTNNLGVTPILPQEPTPSAVAAQENPARPPGPGTKRKKTAAERKAAGQPELNRHVPLHLRLSDSALITIGKKINHYERHRSASYAFSWHGRLYSEYDHLLTKLDERGNFQWGPKVISRLKG
ncbi:hypothetical protein ACLMJK_005711 [Lecanora helva]